MAHLLVVILYRYKSTNNAMLFFFIGYKRNSSKMEIHVFQNSLGVPTVIKNLFIVDLVIVIGISQNIN